MSLVGDTEPITDDELLYRRIPVSTRWYEPAISPRPQMKAFSPTAQDKTGLSLRRAKCVTIEEAARGREGKAYYVAVLNVGQIRAAGMSVISRPVDGQPGHVEIPELTYANHKTTGALESERLLAGELCLRVAGPFES